MSETQPKSQTRSQSRSRVKAQVESQGGVESGSQVKSSTRSRSKPQGESRIESQGGERPRHHEARQGVGQGDVDTTLVGRRVLIAVVAGDRVYTITGTIVAMGRYWVVVDIESSEIESLRGVAYLNKGSIIAYMPVDSETPGSNHDSKTKH